jgi:hypothetical protein
MRALLIDALTIVELMENLIVKPGLGFKTILNIRFGGRNLHTVANQNANKGGNRATQVKVAPDFIGLVLDVDCTHPVAVTDMFDIQGEVSIITLLFCKVRGAKYTPRGHVCGIYGQVILFESKELKQAHIGLCNCFSNAGIE